MYQLDKINNKMDWQGHCIEMMWSDYQNIMFEDDNIYICIDVYFELPQFDISETNRQHLQQ